MKRVILSLCAMFFLLAGCAQKSGNLVFTAVIEEIRDNGIFVVTADQVGFDRAAVWFAEDLDVPFNLLVGQTVEIEALPEIRESYPVQITAVKLSLKDAPQTEETSKAEYQKITPEEAAEKMGADVVVLDVRTQAEFDEGHIPDAVLLPDFEIASRAEKVLPDKEQTILVYCRSGQRSELAAKELIRLGYMGVYDFGGILDWPGELVT